MTEPTHDEYRTRAKMYRLLATFPRQGDDYSRALDDALADPELRATLSALVGVAFGGYIVKYGSFPEAVAVVEREHAVAEDLAGLDERAEEDG